jgi:mono/diheme cytochrome c family protein
MTKALILVLSVLVLAACDTAPQSDQAGGTGVGAMQNVSAPLKRWYSFQQVGEGGRLFAANCASCHGQDAVGAAGWRQPGPDGGYPAPPLNGSGHAWHHPLPMLFQVVKNGSPGGQGNMPAWGAKLSNEEILAIIAWFQSRWSERVYRAWVEIDHRARAGGQG